MSDKELAQELAAIWDLLKEHEDILKIHENTLNDLIQMHDADLFKQQVSRWIASIRSATIFLTDNMQFEDDWSQELCDFAELVDYLERVA